jgi:hypothetical protein
MLLVVPLGITGVSVVHVLAEAAVLPIYIVLLGRFFAVPAGTFWRALAPPVFGAAAAGLVVAAAPMLAIAGASAALLTALAALAAYLVVLVALDRRVVGLARAGLGLRTGGVAA